MQIQTLINYIFTLAVDGGSYDTVSLTFSLKQTGCCKISLQNIQYIHWHLQVTVKKGK